MNLSFVIAEPPDSFGSLETFAFALRPVKELGCDGVEFHLMRCAGFETKTFLLVVESTRVPARLSGPLRRYDQRHPRSVRRAQIAACSHASASAI